MHDDSFIMDWNQCYAIRSEWSVLIRWLCVKKRHFDEWRTDARQLDGPRGEEEFHASASPGKRMTGNRDRGRRAGEHGVNYFSCASMGLKPPARCCTRDACEWQLPASFLIALSMIIDAREAWTLLSSPWKRAGSIQRNDSDATSPLGLSIVIKMAPDPRLKPSIRLEQSPKIILCVAFYRFSCSEVQFLI